LRERGRWRQTEGCDWRVSGDGLRCDTATRRHRFSGRLTLRWLHRQRTTTHASTLFLT